MATITVMIVIFSLFTASLTITAVAKMLRAQKKRTQERRTILTDGATAQAVINSIRQTNAQVDDQPVVLLDLTVTKPDGEVVHTTVRTAIQIVNIPSFQKGCAIEVKYLTLGGEPKFEVVGAYVP